MASKSGGKGKKTGGAGHGSSKPAVKKNVNAGRGRSKPAAKQSGNRLAWIVGPIVLAVLFAVLLSANSTTPQAGTPAGGTSAQQPGPAGSAQAAQATPEEQKYIGRFLPAGYQAPVIAGPTPWTSTVKMTDVASTEGKTDISIPKADVVSDRIVYFEYAKRGAEAVPMVAYVRPSGKLFVGVSYCVPCKGKGQRMESDGTLTCESCGTKRDPETLVGISGACRLYPLDEIKSKVVGGKIVIDKVDINDWTPQPLDRKVGA